MKMSTKPVPRGVARTIPPEDAWVINVYGNPYMSTQSPDKDESGHMQSPGRLSIALALGHHISDLMILRTWERMMMCIWCWMSSLRPGIVSTQDQSQWRLRFEKNIRLPCASVILRACAIETIHLTLLVKNLGKQLSSCRAPRQDGFGVCPKIRSLWVQIPLRTKLSGVSDLKKKICC